VPTGNPTPTFDGRVREGDNLFSDSIVALNVATGKMAWYFQYTPHDTHDYDSAQVPVLFDGIVDGKPRKLLAQANREGYFFVLDRTTGKDILTKLYIPTMNWAEGLRPTGQPNPNQEKEPQVGGSLVSPSSDGSANFEAPTFSPATGIFYVNSTTSWSLFYASPDPGGPGHSEYTGFIRSALRAIDYKTGDVKWEHDYPGGAFSVGAYPGALSTAGNVVFAGDPVGNLIGFDAITGKILWHSPLGAEATNSPITFEMDGHEYVVMAAGDSLYAFYLQ
jgi:alcohol dehydrogenase (cytochrome c)